MDKYYMLLRRWVNASFRLLARSQWNPIIVNRYNEILVDVVNGPLAWANPRTPASLGWHLADLWVEELDKVLREVEDVRDAEGLPKIGELLTVDVLIGTGTHPNTAATIQSTPHTDK